MQWLLLALTWADFSSASPAHDHFCSTSASGLAIHSTNGPITGHWASNVSCVAEYLGIPYVQPPVDDLRFAAPERLAYSAEPYEAAAFGYDCPLTASKPVAYPGFTPQAQRIINYFASAAGTPQSEDCLTLNVWTKSTKKEKKPVFVFFYGGRFTVGNTDTPFYNGKYFAEAEDLVVVTVNYRLGVFGFPGYGYANGTQNLGLRDQRAAVEWIRDNIGAFGGDTARIILAGQSSGAVAVDYWAYAYREDPIAAGLIAHSGNAMSFPANTVAVQEAHWDTIVAAVNCSGSNDEAVVMACMRRVDWSAIQTAAAAIKATASTSVLRSIPAFWPKADDEIVFADYVNRTSRGAFAPLPLLLGNNDNENGYYQIPAYAAGVVPTAAQVTAFLLESFTCPVAYQAAARRVHGVAVYAYRYLADWANTRLYPTSGAYHGVDLHMIFGAAADVSGLPTSSPQRRLTALMQRAWSAFCHDPADGLTRVLGWPRFDPATDSLVQLGLDNVPTAVLTRPGTYDEPCSTITMGALGM